MSEPEVGLSGDLARLIANTRCDLNKLVVEHTPDGKGRCPTCKSLGCSLYSSAVAALQIRAKRAAALRAKLGGSTP